jgi:hypothetical protein
MVHRATVLHRAYAACNLAYAAAVIVVCGLSDADPLAIVVAAPFVPLWGVLISWTARRPATGALPDGTRLASTAASIRRAVTLNLAALMVYLPVLLVSRDDGGGWNLASILLGSGLGSLLVARRASAAERLDPAVLQTVRMTWRRGGGGRIAWPREWGDRAPAGGALS